MVAAHQPAERLVLRRQDRQHTRECDGSRVGVLVVTEIDVPGQLAAEDAPVSAIVFLMNACPTRSRRGMPPAAFTTSGTTWLERRS